MRIVWGNYHIYTGTSRYTKGTIGIHRIGRNDDAPDHSEYPSSVAKSVALLDIVLKKWPNGDPLLVSANGEK